MLRRRSDTTRRRGVAVVIVLATMALMAGMAALTIDVGMMYRARQEAQIAADSAAIAAAWQLLDRDKLSGFANMEAEIEAARQEAADYAYRNPVVNQPPLLGEDDVVVGYLHDPANAQEPISFSDPSDFNTVFVRVRRDGETNGPLELFFAAVFGVRNTEISAAATANFKDGVNGYRVTDTTGNAELLPFALHVNSWSAMLYGQPPSQDHWSHDEDSGEVVSGSDGVSELNVYPGGGASQLAPGNFGTVDIGSSNNSTADLRRQILYGISAEDLAHHGGELKLGSDGTLHLNGDTGISAGIKSELEAIVGKARAIPLFDQVSGPGNNATFRIVGFAGVRVMEVQLSGAMHQKRLVLQPAFVVDAAALTGPGSGSSYFVYQPVVLVR